MASEKSLSIVVKARDEASAKMRQMQEDIRKGVTSAVMPFVAVGALIVTAAKAAASGFELMSAKAKLAAAEQKGDMEGMLRAQVAQNEAFAQFGAAVPVVGEAIARMIRTLADTEGIQRQIEEMKRFGEAAERAGDSAVRIANQAALIAAEVAGATRAQMAGLRARQAIRAQQDESLKLTGQIADAERSLAAAQERAAQVEGSILHTLEQRLAAAAAVGRAEDEIAHLLERQRALTEGIAALRAAQADQVAAIADREAEEQRERGASLMRRIRDLFTSDLQHQLDLKRREMDEIIRLAREEGMNVAALERKKQEEMRRIRREFRDREQEEQERAAEAQARAREAAAAAARRQQEDLARARREIEAVAFNATHTQREQDLRDLDRWLADMRAKHAGNAAMLAKIRQAELVRRAQIERTALEREQRAKAGEAAKAAAGRMEIEVRATQARFLTRAQGRDKPLSVQDMGDLTREQTKRFERALEALPPAIARAFADRLAQGAL